jgi:small subunit ribosomal protein S16
VAHARTIFLKKKRLQIMVVIRLARGGSKKNPFYHVVAADKRCPRDGRYLENMGYFNPGARGLAKRIELKEDRIEHWVSQGAQVSDRVKRIIKEAAAGLTGPKAHKPKAPAKPVVEAKAEEAPAEEAKEAAPEEVKAEETPVEATPTEEAPAEDKPAEEAPADDKPADDA